MMPFAINLPSGNEQETFRYSLVVERKMEACVGQLYIKTAMIATGVNNTVHKVIQ